MTITLCRYQYDPLDRLAACSPAGLDSVQRFYQQSRLATEIQGQIQRTVFQTQDHLLAQHRGANGCALIATDQQRSVLHGLDATQEQAVAYAPYGARHPQADPLGLLGFTGERADPVTRHYLLGNGYRAFNPVLMRFNSPDSLSPFAKGGLNSYAYCAGDPVNNVDPSGHFFSKLVGLIGKLSHAINAPATFDKQVDYARQFPAVSRQALTRNPNPVSAMPGARQLLDIELLKLRSDAPFIHKLSVVNANLASYGSDSLSIKHAMKYLDLAKHVASGEISNTTAHWLAASSWGQKYRADRRPSGFVGVVFNIVGGVVGGSEDHSRLKTGASLRGGS